MNLTAKSPKPKKCDHCGEKFTPRMGSIGQKACSPSCALAMAPQGREKAAKALAKVEGERHREAKERVKTKGEYAKEAQAVINRYVRLRDAHLGCVSCDKPASWGGQWHCSHFRSVGAAPHIRFNLWNMHKSCSQCNSHLSGNLARYRPALIEKIGQERVDWLECDQGFARHDILYLKRIKTIFAKKSRRLEARIQCNAE